VEESRIKFVRIQLSAIRPVPGEVAGLTHRRLTASLQRLEWSPLPGEDVWYDVYRGDLATLSTGAYDHRAVPGGCVVPSASLDVADLADGVSRYYLVAATNLAEEGTLGSGAAGPRPHGVPSCP
jgi:hypothetical protein